MEIFGRSPYTPTSAYEWLMLFVVLAAIGVSATLAADRTAAALMLCAGSASYLFDSALYLPVGTVKSRLFSIREHLKQQLKAKTR